MNLGRFAQSTERRDCARQSLGISVLATQVGSIEEITLEGQTGHVVATYNINGLVERTKKLYCDQILSRFMSSAARDFATQNFSVECCA